MRNLFCLTVTFISIKFGICHLKKNGSGLPYRGKYTGRCRGDGMYYRDSYSFVICTHSLGYLQPCPPGTRNGKYETYNSHGSPHFCAENLVNIGYTVHNNHPLHGPRSFRGAKHKRLLDRRIGRSEKHHHLHARHKSSYSVPSLSRSDYAKPEGSKYSSRVEHSVYGHQSKPDQLHYHTGSEFHGPYRDQAKEVSPIEEENTEQKTDMKGFDINLPIKNHREKENIKFEDDVNDRNDISSELEHPMLTVHRSNNHDIEAHQVMELHPDHSNGHTFKIRKNTTPFLSEEGRSMQHMNAKYRDEDEEKEMYVRTMLNRQHEQRSGIWKNPHYLNENGGSAEHMNAKDREEDNEREMYARTMLNRHHERRSRKTHHYLSEDGESAEHMKAGDPGYRDEEREKDERTMLNRHHEQRLGNFRDPDHDVSRPRPRIDLTRIKLIPVSDRHEKEYHQPKNPEEIMHWYSGYHKRDFEVPRYLAELKEKILMKYREEQFKENRDPMYDQYSRSNGGDYSSTDERSY